MSNESEINIIFFGDIVGAPGRKIVSRFIEQQKSVDNTFIIANVENASHGFGLTEGNYNELSDVGIDIMTSGNHIWDKKDIFNYINKAEKLLRPINYPETVGGSGSRIFEKGCVKIGVINALGKVFIDTPVSSWLIIEEEIKRLKTITPIVLIDFHAEATAEKVAFARYCAGMGASAVLGTHTHVQTSDEQIIDKQTAYITDVGFCGASDSVIGMRYEESIRKILTGVPERFEVAKGNQYQINAVTLKIDTKSGRALNIKRINLNTNISEVENI